MEPLEPTAVELLASMRQISPVPPRPLRKKPCKDCAVVNGFYLLHSEALALAPKAEQIERSRSWFCHSTPRKACRGNAEHLAIVQEMLALEQQQKNSAES